MLDIPGDTVYNKIIRHFEKIYKIDYEKLDMREGSVYHGKSLNTAQAFFIINLDSNNTSHEIDSLKKKIIEFAK